MIVGSPDSNKEQVAKNLAKKYKYGQVKIWNQFNTECKEAFLRSAFEINILTDPALCDPGSQKQIVEWLKKTAANPLISVIQAKSNSVDTQATPLVESRLNENTAAKLASVFVSTPTAENHTQRLHEATPVGEDLKKALAGVSELELWKENDKCLIYVPLSLDAFQTALKLTDIHLTWVNPDKYSTFINRGWSWYICFFKQPIQPYKDAVGAYIRAEKNSTRRTLRLITKKDDGTYNTNELSPDRLKDLVDIELTHTDFPYRVPLALEVQYNFEQLNEMILDNEPLSEIQQWVKEKNIDLTKLPTHFKQDLISTSITNDNVDVVRYLLDSSYPYVNLKTLYKANSLPMFDLLYSRGFVMGFMNSTSVASMWMDVTDSNQLTLFFKKLNAMDLNKLANKNEYIVDILRKFINHPYPKALPQMMEFLKDKTDSLQPEDWRDALKVLASDVSGALTNPGCVPLVTFWLEQQSQKDLSSTMYMLIAWMEGFEKIHKLGMFILDIAHKKNPSLIPFLITSQTLQAFLDCPRLKSELNLITNFLKELKDKFDVNFSSFRIHDKYLHVYFKDKYEFVDQHYWKPAYEFLANEIRPESGELLFKDDEILPESQSLSEARHVNRRFDIYKTTRKYTAYQIYNPEYFETLRQNAVNYAWEHTPEGTARTNFPEINITPHLDDPDRCVYVVVIKGRLPEGFTDADRFLYTVKGRPSPPDTVPSVIINRCLLDKVRNSDKWTTLTGENSFLFNLPFFVSPKHEKAALIARNRADAKENLINHVKNNTGTVREFALTMKRFKIGAEELFGYVLYYNRLDVLTYLLSLNASQPDSLINQIKKDLNKEWPGVPENPSKQKTLPSFIRSLDVVKVLLQHRVPTAVFYSQRPSWLLIENELWAEIRNYLLKYIPSARNPNKDDDTASFLAFHLSPSNMTSDQSLIILESMIAADWPFGLSADDVSKMASYLDMGADTSSVSVVTRYFQHIISLGVDPNLYIETPKLKQPLLICTLFKPFLTKTATISDINTYSLTTARLLLDAGADPNPTDRVVGGYLLNLVVKARLGTADMVKLVKDLGPKYGYDFSKPIVGTKHQYKLWEKHDKGFADKMGNAQFFKIYEYWVDMCRQATGDILFKDDEDLSKFESKKNHPYRSQRRNYY